MKQVEVITGFIIHGWTWVPRNGEGCGAISHLRLQCKRRTERGQELSELCVGANRELRGVTASGTFPHVVQDGGNRWSYFAISFPFSSITFAIWSHFLSFRAKNNLFIIALLKHAVFLLTAKKVKKKKGKTIALNEFLAKDGENGPSNAAVFSARSTSWADESENLNTEGMYRF